MWLIDQDSSITGSIEDSSFFFFYIRAVELITRATKNPHFFANCAALVLSISSSQSQLHRGRIAIDLQAWFALTAQEITLHVVPSRPLHATAQVFLSHLTHTFTLVLAPPLSAQSTHQQEVQA